MKLPFNSVLNLVLKPYFGESRQFCQHPMFGLSVLYTYMYAALGFLLNVNHIRKNIGEIPEHSSQKPLSYDMMLLHDLKIIACSMGIVQYACLFIGCFSKNPALFLPHLLTQVIVFCMRFLNIIGHLIKLNLKSLKKDPSRIARMILMVFNWLQEFCVFRQILCVSGASSEPPEGVHMRVRTLLVALLGVSMSACAFASQPVELELDDEDVSQRLNNVSFARRITKPTIRLVMGYGKLSAFITAGSSLLLLVAVMSKQAWWRRGARWLAAPALLVTALEAASDAGDAMLAAALRSATEPARVAAQTAAAALLVTVEILVWYFIAKFFEYNPPTPAEENEKEELVRALPQ